jgi:hypothetical protein
MYERFVGVALLGSTNWYDRPCNFTGVLAVPTGTCVPYPLRGSTRDVGRVPAGITGKRPNLLPPKINPTTN